MKVIFKTIFAAAVLAGVALASAAASASGRADDAAIDAVSAVIVSGRIGLVTGSLIANTDGSNISRGVNFHNRRQYDDGYFDGSNEGHRSASR